MMGTDLIYKPESHQIIGAAIEVHRTLGNGFLEQVYQEALSIEFEKQGIPFEKEKQIRIQYKDSFLEKAYIADFVCYDKIILECKAVGHLLPEHESQVINYLYATGFQLGLLINFGKYQIEIKRIANIDGKMKRQRNELPAINSKSMKNNLFENRTYVGKEKKLPTENTKSTK